jgi:ribosome-binding protein aMBF1 (putative translation factor)
LFLGTQDENMKDMTSKGRRRGHDCRGEKGGNAKLTWDVVREIRRRRKEVRITKKKLATEFGVSESLIDKIVRNIYWKE